MINTELTLDQLQAVAGGIPNLPPHPMLRLSYAEAAGLDSSTVDVVNKTAGILTGDGFDT